ncbi:hypothetical protein ACFO5K_25740 [Nocardia halotolerans]|uniref:Uncharacterized protein n=1 Tax=Nocardia halotolerans TaxID=1755878 RepID=A0ABV8VN61_9NOCA
MQNSFHPSMSYARTRVLGCLAIAATAVLTVSGCGTTNGSPVPGEPDVRTLDVGSYAKATAPLDMRYDYHNDLSGAMNLAVVRLSEHVVTGIDIDPKIEFGTGSIAILDADKATEALANANKPTLERNQMMFGFASSSTDKEPDEPGKVPPGATFATVTVMQFPDDETAKRAAAEIEETDFAVAADQNERVSVPKYSAAHSHWRPGVATIGSTLAYGQYVVNLYLGTPEAELGALTALAEKAYDAQLPLLDRIPALSPAEMLFLPNDPDEMLRRTLNPDGLGAPDLGRQASMTLRGFLHKVRPRGYWDSVMTEAGVDRFSLSMSMSSATMLFRSRDDESAEKLLSQILERVYPTEAPPPSGLPGARCGEDPDDDYKTDRFRCAVMYRQYVATVESDQLTDAHQRAAAQYALLANSQ